MNRKIRLWVVLPPSILIVISVLLNIFMPNIFLETVDYLNNKILDIFGKSYSIVGIVMLLLCIIIYIHPISKTKIGGENAKPILKKYTWFGVALCTSVAAGVLFWAIAEPLYHMTQPPKFLGIAPNSKESAIFAMSTMFLHWCFTPYAIYTVPSVLFAYMYYNKKKSNSLSSIASPLIGDKLANKLSPFIDGLALYTLIPGMASSLATGILTICGGINYITGITINTIMIFIVMVTIVSMFIVSCTTGLTNGIRKLSNLNIIMFGLLILIVLIFTDLGATVKLGGKGFTSYVSNFVQNSTLAAAHPQDSWGKSWTVFYWCNWMAWAPITALFLGRISYGYTIKEAIFVNFIAPALCAIVWITIFSGSVINIQLNDNTLGNMLIQSGAESAVFKFLEIFPLSRVIIPLFVAVLFISLITACDSTTASMSNLCYSGIKKVEDEASIGIKIFWGVLVGLLGFIMLSTNGIEGIKILSSIGGLPGLVIQVVTGLSTIILLINFKREKKNETKVEEEKIKSS
ncbi:BCCT family transporter [Paraclostridium ghonii]|uniref:Choline-glycine betaine transporter n=1 Tax=Paraclostridium ghonii TaxID=29358 RepID=A0ABU0MYW4_9FIRM|nr:BCCT family transporter [Paeniclostridium ghonii]MDQ0555784.1 choline-glycine betaine transporter [Paeniclostridium ghonii]